jgi:hypothetical protein
MQAKLKRREAAFHSRSVGLSIAIFAGVPLIAALTLGAPDRALAACGASSHPAGVHTGVGGGVHVATSTVATSGGSGGSGTLGCAGGSSASGLRGGLPTAASGRVVEPGAHAARTETHARTATTRTATTRTTNASAHLRTVGPGHRA